MTVAYVVPVFIFSPFIILWGFETTGIYMLDVFIEQQNKTYTVGVGVPIDPSEHVIIFKVYIQNFFIFVLPSFVTIPATIILILKVKNVQNKRKRIANVSDIAEKMQLLQVTKKLVPFSILFSSVVIPRSILGYYLFFNGENLKNWRFLFEGIVIFIEHFYCCMVGPTHFLSNRDFLSSLRIVKTSIVKIFTVDFFLKLCCKTRNA